MSKTANSSWETTGKPIVVLTVISLIVSLLLALVNGMTAPVIKENTRRTTLAAYVSVMPSVSDAATLEEVTDYTTANVTGVVKAPDGGIAIKAEEKGFDGGILTVIMGFDANGAETGICPRVTHPSATQSQNNQSRRKSNKVLRSTCQVL